MKLVQQTHDQLTVTLVPLLFWGIGIVLLLLAAGLQSFVAKLFLLGFSVLILFGLGETATCRFNKATGQVLLKRWNLLGSKRVRCSIRDVIGVDIQTAHGDSNDVYRVCLTLAQGELFPLTTYYSSGRQEKQEVADKIRRFLNLPKNTDPT
ncbi:cytochrome b-245 chaperone 1/Eros family protein [Pantanalinema sp. GBBB05]|uniref:cytochrome b-245 chaperone 1/Eros family protein n=1 Tax=Pantanalinema sp. GBBB05 TaxID=2604139 RepID=UPI001D4D411B|nr:DUF4564 domain-containing protein [Pantanalinema sp. GBBB05]